MARGTLSRRIAWYRSGAGLLWRALSGGNGQGRRPARQDLRERLQAFPRRLPIQDELRIYWNRHQVPFLEAVRDRDLAVGLGAVHAHLRWSQIEFLRRIAAGRLAEAVGPAALEIDAAMRLLDVGRAAPEIESRLPDETRAWLSGFADGLNAYMAQADERPYELAFLGLEPEPFTVHDLIALSRLASADFTWRVWVRLASLRERPDWQAVWQRLTASGPLPVPAFGGSDGGDANRPDGLLASLDRSGSNAFAVSGARTAKGGPIVASDPHLPLGLPNLWLIAGYESPSHHAVGLMIPGVPGIAIGRNPWIAWGGTSLRAASSDLFDLSDVPERDIRTRRVRVKVRWARDAVLELRESPFGPVISDAAAAAGNRRKPAALHWLGHRPSDEISALLALNRASSRQEFLDALEGFSVPAKSMVYADVGGRIGQAMAARLPRRPAGPLPSDMVLPLSALAHWDSFATARALPHRINPPEGFVASANDPPACADMAIGYFFSPGERITRLRALLEGNDRLAAEEARDLQTDVVVPAAGDLRNRLVELLDGAGGESPPLAALKAWDGAYAVNSPGALAFELMVHFLVLKLHGRADAAVYAAAWDSWSLLRADLETIMPERLRRAALGALRAAEKPFRRLGTWGEAHRLRLAHPFARIPGLGRRFHFADLPSAGANQTLMKTAFGFAGGRHAVRFGANARHVSDLADPDANFFVLLGGQDGWLGSSTFVDQLHLWRHKQMIRVPLRVEAVRSAFQTALVIRPAGGNGG